jgi:hypothetical protein
MGQPAHSPDTLPYRGRVTELLRTRMGLASDTVDALFDAHRTRLDLTSASYPVRAPTWRTLSDTLSYTLVDPTPEFRADHFDAIAHDVDALSRSDVERAFTTYNDLLGTSLRDDLVWFTDVHAINRLSILPIPVPDSSCPWDGIDVEDYGIRYPLSDSSAPVTAVATATVTVPASSTPPNTRTLTVERRYDHKADESLPDTWAAVTVDTDYQLADTDATLPGTTTTYDPAELSATALPAPGPLTSWIATNFLDFLPTVPEVLSEHGPLCDRCGPVDVDSNLITARPVNQWSAHDRPDTLCPACYSSHLVDETALTEQTAIVYAHHHSNRSPSQIATHLGLDTENVEALLAEVRELRATSARTTQLIETTPRQPSK